MPKKYHSTFNNTIKVVHVASGDLWGGAEAQILALTKMLVTSGKVNLLVVLLNHGILEEKLKNNDIEVIVYDETKLNTFQILLRMIQLFRKFHPGIVHTHRQKENVIGSIAKLFIKNCHSIRTVHGAEEHRLKSWQIFKRLFRLMNWFSGRYLQNLIVAVSSDLGKQLAHEFPRDKICVIQNGIDIKEIQKQAINSTKLTFANRFHIAFIGRLVPVKRVDLFIQITKELNDTVHDTFDFYIIGDGPMRKKIEKMIANLALENSVHLLGFQNNIPAILNKIDMLYITSDHEGLPMNLLEALCMNVPVVAHAVGEIPKVLDSGKYGTLIYNQDIPSYIKPALEYVSDPKPYKLKSTLAVKRVREIYSSLQTANNYIRIYDKIIN